MTRAEAAELARAVKAAKSPTLSDRFWSKVDIRGLEECWPWTAAVRNPKEGYGAFWLDGRHHPAPRVAYQLAYGDFEDGKVACHSCDNPSCCNPLHIFQDTPKGNNDDKVRKRRHAFGEANGFSKLTEDQVREIKAAKPDGRTPYGFRAALAARFGVSRATITDIWSRRWTHI